MGDPTRDKLRDLPPKQVYRRNIISWLNKSVIKAFPEVQGGYHRMPDQLQREPLTNLKALCTENDLAFEHCFANVLKRNPYLHGKENPLT
jgi:hypothetical protein